MPVTEKASLMESVNEGIALFATDGNPPETPETRWMFVCECGLPECVEWVELELSAFEEIRSGATSPSWTRVVFARSSRPVVSRTTSFGIFTRSVSIRPVMTSRS